MAVVRVERERKRSGELENISMMLLLEDEIGVEPLNFVGKPG